MKHCDNCNKDFEPKEDICPICGSKLQDTKEKEEENTEELVSTMILTGIL